MPGVYPSPDLAQFAALASTIPTTKFPLSMYRFATNGYASQGDIGKGAVYTRAASAGGPGAVQDKSGYWWQIDVDAPGCGPHWFGAKCDGSANDTSAINLCAVACAGKSFTFYPSNHKITATISIPAYTTVYGYGATLTSTSQITMMSFANGGALNGLTLAGPASATYNASGIGVSCQGTNNAPSAPTFVNAPVLRDCSITNLGFYGVFFAYVNGGVVERCLVSGVGYAGIAGVSCNDTVVDRNYVLNIGPGSGPGDAYGIFLDRYNGTSEASDPRSYRCTISNNDVRSVVANAATNGQGIDTHGGVDFTICGNRVSACQVGIAVTGSSVSSTPTLGPQQVSVVGNVIDGLSVNYGILVSGAINGGSVVEFATGIVVQGNTILNHGAPNDALNGAIFIQGTKGLVLSGNSIRNPRSVGINLGISNIGFDVSGNTITDPHDTVFAAPCCLRVSANDNRGFIGGNTFAFDNSGVDTYVAVESVRVASGLTGLALTLGKCAFIGIDATHLTYQELTSTGVNAAGFYSERGIASITLTSGNANGSLSVAFANRFPATPKTIVFGQTGGIIPGNKIPIMTTNTLAATGFNMFAYPVDLGNWTATGTLTVCWEAST